MIDQNDTSGGACDDNGSETQEEQLQRQRSGFSRRQFLRLGLGTGASLFIPGGLVASADRYQRAVGERADEVNRYLCSVDGRTASMGIARLSDTQTTASGLGMFLTDLRGVGGPDGIPVAVPDDTVAWGRTRAAHYTIDINQYTDQLHAGFGPTTLWGYNPRKALGVVGAPTQRHLGGIIVAKRDSPIQITFQNNLPTTHFLPVDTTIMGADGAQNRTTIHLHGGLTPWISDGGPYTWFDPNGNYGESVAKKTKRGKENLYKRLNPKLKDGQAEYYFPISQSARMLWYHDHAIGITRLNAYAGLASALIIRDDFEASLRRLGLPDFVENGGRELPLVIQDKLFHADGALGYPDTYPTDAYRYANSTIRDLPPTSVVPEMFGDTMLVNGTVYPDAKVAAARYRLRILNACQARFLNLQLYVTTDGVTPDTDTTKPVPSFLVLGTEGGFLARPVLVPANVPFTYDPVIGAQTIKGSLITAPAERWDVIVDFSVFAAGTQLILYNDAPAPFPMGDDANDYNTPGCSPNTRVLMRFTVGAGAVEPKFKITTQTHLALNPSSGIDKPLAGKWTTQPLPAPRHAKVRNLTLNETNDAYGRLIQMLGTNDPHPITDWQVDPDFGTSYSRGYMDPATETVHAGDVEVWSIANLTADTHPIHFHLVNVQILSRRPFDVVAYKTNTGSNYTPVYTGPARGPEITEQGWKDTVQMHPGEVTTVIMKFGLPNVPFTVPPSLRTGGHEYVWHCHILEHEEHDMMRPLIVTD